MRHYIAFMDDGHDGEEFNFQSDHRAGSRQNRKDCKRQWRSSHGKSLARRYEPIRINLDKIS